MNSTQTNTPILESKSYISVEYVKKSGTCCKCKADGKNSAILAGSMKFIKKSRFAQYPTSFHYECFNVKKNIPYSIEFHSIIKKNLETHDIKRIQSLFDFSNGKP